MASLVGRELLHYALVRELGRGAMGEVYLAEDRRLGRSVAIKVLPVRLASDGDLVGRFTREAKTVAALNHPGIVTLHAFEQAHGLHFLVLEHVEGETLDRLISARGGSPELARRFALQLAEALSYAHERRIIHRDLKPGNIMVCDSGERVKVLDFGLAKIDPLGGPQAAADAPTDLLTQDGSMLGTLRYMSPEQARAEPVDSRSDLFSLGVVLYELATGRHPFPVEGPVVLAAILSDDPAPLAELQPGLEPELAELILACMEKEPARRPTASQLVERLRGSSPAPPVPAGEAEPDAGEEIRSIAVLPFTDMSPRGDQGYFCDGMAEELINGLSRIKGLAVVSRTSALRFRDPARDLGVIGEALGAASVLEGSVRKAGKRLRISVQLVATGSGYQLWSERFDREESDLFEIQDDIARRVVEALELELGGERPAPRARPQTTDLEAHHLYLKGRHQWGRRTEEGLRKSIELFRQAIDRDPAHARAWAGTGDAFAMLGVYGVQPPLVVMPKARAAAERALELDPDLAEAHASLGCVLSLHEWNWQAASQAFERALELDPAYATGHHWYAMNHLVPLARFFDAGEHARRARQLDPLAPAVGVGVGLVAYFAQSFDDAVHELGQIVDLEPGFAVGRYFLGRALVEAGELDRGVAALERAVELSGRSAEMIAALGNARARRGEAAAAERLLAELASRAESGYVSASLSASIHAGLGDTEAAIISLESGLEERSTDLAWLAVAPVYDGLRESDDIRRLLRRMRLA